MEELTAKYLCFYSSDINTIATVEQAMEMPIDEKAITRCYCIKEEAIIEGNRIHQIGQKIKRLLTEGALVNLGAEKWSETSILELIK